MRSCWRTRPRATCTSRRCLLAQTRRMLQDDRVRGLAIEFGGNWLDFRRFEEHNSVDRERFPSSPTSCGRRCSRSRSGSSSTWCSTTARCSISLRQAHVRQSGAGQALRHAGRRRRRRTSGCASTTRTSYGRGGLLPMAVFLTQNAPGLRTSPVKRGYWVVRRLLGEQIPPPPPNVPELPADEAKLGELTLPRDAGPAPRGQELRRLPRAVRFVRPGVRRLRARSASGGRRTWAAGRSRRRATFPGGSEGDGPGRPAELSARTAAGRISRQPLPQAVVLRPGPQPAACPTTDCSRQMRHEAGGR